MLLHKACRYVWSMPGGSDSKESVFNAGDPGLIPGLEKFHGEGNSSQLQYSCLENFMDRGVWWLQSMWSQRIRRDWVTNAAGRLPLAYQEAAHLSFERVKPQHPNIHNRLTIHLCLNGTPLQYSCLENPMDGGAWKAVVHGVAEGWTGLSDFTFTFHFHAMEKEMATHSSVLAWRVPGTGEPGGLPSMGSHRVGHDWSDLA